MKAVVMSRRRSVATIVSLSTLGWAVLIALAVVVFGVYGL